MITDDENAFLKSITGAAPIKKNNKVEKQIPLAKAVKKEKPKIERAAIKQPPPILQNNIKPSTSFKIESTPLNKKLKKGKIPIDKKIDFHGRTLFEAEILFSETIIYCYENNLRCLLFVTGKGVLNKNNESLGRVKLYYGKIRNGFFSWVKKIELQKYILTVEQANMGNGADGAFFVYLRKKKIKSLLDKIKTP